MPRFFIMDCLCIAGICYLYLLSLYNISVVLKMRRMTHMSTCMCRLNHCRLCCRCGRTLSPTASIRWGTNIPTYNFRPGNMSHWGIHC